MDKFNKELSQQGCLQMQVVQEGADTYNVAMASEHSTIISNLSSKDAETLFSKLSRHPNRTAAEWKTTSPNF